MRWCLRRLRIHLLFTVFLEQHSHSLYKIMFRRVVQSQSRVGGKRWASAIASQGNTSGGSSSGSTGGGINGVSVACIAGIFGSFMLFRSYAGDSHHEKALQKQVAARKASGEIRADPYQVQVDIQEYLRLLDPSSASQLVQVGIKLCTRGHDATVESNEYYPFLAKLKEKNSIMSWADIGALMTYCALIEMGAPLVGIRPKFGRIDGLSTVRLAAVPNPDTTDAADLLAYGKQFDLTEAETAALFGGSINGSLLLGDSKEAIISTRNYSKIANVTTDLLTIPYAKALSNSEYFKKCSEVFEEDPLRWNRFFARALVKIFESNWQNLSELPKRMQGTTRNRSWSSRQAEVYGVHQPYEGATKIREL